MVSSLLAARAGNVFLSSHVEEKLLSFNTGKSVSTIVGKKKEAQNMRNEVVRNPLLLSGKPMKMLVIIHILELKYTRMELKLHL